MEGGCRLNSLPHKTLGTGVFRGTDLVAGGFDGLFGF
jgi:hypothetical protein